jgi:signal transduction histidine kinase
VNVLIAEDEPIPRRILQAALQSWGHEVVAAADGAEAWQRFQAEPVPFVISDWQMPHLDGLELVRRIRTNHGSRYTYVILLTSRSNTGDVVQGMEAGADDFVAKPFDREELRVRVRAGERVIQLERDLAEQNRALRQAQAALVQQEKLASLGQLAAGLAHEINNPIAFVSNNFTVIQRDGLALLDLLTAYRAAEPLLARADAGRAAELAGRAEELDVAYLQTGLPRLFDASQRGLQRVRDIVRNLRDFARLDEAEFKEVDLNDAVRQTLEIIGHELKQKSLTVTTRLEAARPLLGHAGKINQVLLNLLLNALQACAAGGAITVTTGGDADGAVVDVEDNGCGIAADVLPRVFEPFFTTKPVGQGTGLGLSVSYGIVRDHGGRIEVASTPGQGSRFRVHLPWRAPAGPA